MLLLMLSRIIKKTKWLKLANTKLIMFYIFFLVIFNTFAGMFALSDESKDFNISSYMKVSEAQNKLEQRDDFLSSVLKIVLFPFILIDFIVVLTVIIGLSVSILPPIINVILFVPLGIMIIFDYIIPVIRGN